MRHERAVIGFGIGALVVLMVAIVVIFDPTEPPPIKKVAVEKTTSEEEMLPYSVLRRTSRSYDHLVLEILVESDATKSEVMELAHSLRKQHDERSIMFIDIFDSEEAWRRKGDETYPEENYWSHYLVQVARNRSTGLDTVMWIKGSNRSQ